MINQSLKMFKNKAGWKIVSIRKIIYFAITLPSF